MAFNAYLQVVGVAGESTDQNHTGWIEIDDFDESVSQTLSGSFSAGGAPATGKPVFTPLTIKKNVDKASPLLYKGCAAGTVYATVVIDVCRATGDNTPYLNYKLENVVIAGIGIASTKISDVDDVPIETISFAAGRITKTFTPTDAKTGKPGANVVGGYDRIQNSVI